MTEQDILAIAEKVVELQEKKSQTKQVAVNNTAEISNKYHKQLWERFGSTGTIESAVRSVACYIAGGRTLSSLNLEQHYKCLEIMDELYRRILGGV